jgi:hypothetical protein
MGLVFAYVAHMLDLFSDNPVIAVYKGDVSIQRNGKTIKVTGKKRIYSGDTVLTGKDSVCRINSMDGSVLGLNEYSGICIELNREGNISSFVYKEGQVFTDVAPRKEGFFVTTDRLSLQVLGTRFQIRGAEDPGVEYVDVFDGSVKLNKDESGVHLTSGSTGITKLIWADSRNKKLGKKAVLYVNRPVKSTVPVEWLEKIEYDTQGLLAAFDVPADPAYPIDFNTVSIRNGMWRISGKGKDAVIAQENPETQDMASILFGKPEWTKGTVSFDFKIHEYFSNTDTYSVMLNFFYSDSYSFEGFGLTEQVKRLKKSGYKGWVTFKADFTVQNDSIRVKASAFPLPGIKKGTYFPFEKTPKNSLFIKKRKKCGIGLQCKGVVVTFKNLRIKGTKHTGSSESGINPAEYRVFRKGNWESGKNKHGVYSRQTDKNAQTSFISFGKPEYTRGRFSGRVRVNSVNSSEKDPVMDLTPIGICFFYRKLKNMPYPGGDLVGLDLETGVWYDFVFTFKTHDNMTTVEYTVNKTAETPGSDTAIRNKIVFDVKTDTINSREACAVGMCTRKRVTAEWSCLKLENTEKKGN